MIPILIIRIKGSRWLMRKIVYQGGMVIFFMLLLSCSSNTEPAKEADYETTKKMIVDILQTEDGKKALSEVLNDDEMKQRLVIDSDTVKDALKEQLLADEGKEVWTDYFKDPEFADIFASSLEKEHIELLKRIMNDAAFQKQIIEVFQDPALSEHLLTILKSQSFREHLESLIIQNLNTPSFQAKVKLMIEESNMDESSKKDGDNK